MKKKPSVKRLGERAKRATEPRSANITNVRRTLRKCNVLRKSTTQIQEMKKMIFGFALLLVLHGRWVHSRNETADARKTSLNKYDADEKRMFPFSWEKRTEIYFILSAVGNWFRSFTSIRTIKDWNQLPTTLKITPSVKTKSLIKSFYQAI